MLELGFNSLIALAAFAAVPAGTFPTISQPKSSSVGSTFGISLNVRTTCLVSFRSSSLGFGASDDFALGSIAEFCNASGGYDLYVRYQPGSLRGAKLTLGGEQVELDGTGYTLVSARPGARRLDNALSIRPSVGGFDTSSIDFQVLPRS